MIIMALLVAIFIFHAVSLSFTQDDAFISYRYVNNFLRGYGLVFNPSERVEGYTNFLFVMQMIVAGLFGLDYIMLSKIIGIASGVGILWLSYRWMSALIQGRRHYLWLFAVPVVLAANAAFSYWAISGLETLLFSALIFFGIYLAATKNPLFVPLLALATLVRPEGGLVFVVTLSYLFISREYRMMNIVRFFIIYVLLTLPQFIFRLYYYGDLLPNPFYAKTGWSIEYFGSGIGYLWLFLRQYGFFGILILIPLVSYKLLPRSIRLPVVISLIYMLYIIMVGGDVLHGHRFFVPLMPLLYLSFFAGCMKLLEKIRWNSVKSANISIVGIILIAAVWVFFLPFERIRIIRDAEIALVSSMKYQSDLIRGIRSDRYSIACSTIGAFGYYSDAVIIDMLGLTDRTIAHDPRPVEGIKTTWKERNYNIPYLMSRNPDLILFSTGLKPSAPAEKALFLSSKFRKGYYPVFHTDRQMWTIFKRKPGYSGADEYFPNPEFVDKYALGLYFYHEGKYDIALEYATQSARVGPPDFYLGATLMADILLKKENVERAVALWREAFDMSGGYAMIAGDQLGRYYTMIGDTAGAESYFKIVQTNNQLY